MRQMLIFSWVLALGVLFLAGEAHAGLPARTLELRDALTQRISYPGLDDNKATLMDVLDDLVKKAREAKKVELTFDINENAFKAEQVMDVGKTEVANPALPPMNATLDTILKKILSRIAVPSRAVYVIRKDHIEITTGAYLGDEFYLRGCESPEDDPYPRGSDSFRYPLIIASFQSGPLDRALNELASQSSCNVILDLRADKAGKNPVTADFFNVPFDEAVLLLADMAGLESVRVGRTCYVTTRENAKVMREAQERERRQRKKELPSEAPPRAQPPDGARSKAVSPALDKPDFPGSHRGNGK